jgi:hypothetical protein
MDFLREEKSAPRRPRRLWRHMPNAKVVLRRHAKRIRHPVKESKHRGDVDGLRNLILAPAQVTQLLHITMGRARCRPSDDLDIVEERAFRQRQAGLIQLAFENRRYALIGSSLNTQEVSMAVESIRTTVQKRYMAGDRFFDSPCQMAFRKMNCVREVHHLP